MCILEKGEKERRIEVMIRKGEAGEGLGEEEREKGGYIPWHNLQRVRTDKYEKIFLSMSLGRQSKVAGF